MLADNAPRLRLKFVGSKHVRSEKDPYTLMRMIDVNVFGYDKDTARFGNGCEKYFVCQRTRLRIL